MKLTVLGKYGPYPKAGGATSGYLLKTNDKIVVLDMGSETLSKFPLQITNFPFAAVILYFAAILIVSDIVNVDKVVKRISGAFAFSIIIIAVIFSFAA